MDGDVTLGGAAGLVVQSWRVEDGELVLTFVSAEGSRILRCRCGRRHWIVETRQEEDRTVLAVSCHGCGTTGAFPLAEGTAPLAG